MKKKLTLLVMTFLFIVSCSNDSEGDEMDMTQQNDLVGRWGVTDFRFDTSVVDEELELATEIIRLFLNGECYLLTFDFMENGMVASESKVEYIEPDPNGFSFDCPDQSDVVTASWSLEGDQLTIGAGSEEETVTITFEDANTLVLGGAVIEDEEFGEAEVVLTRLE